MNSKRLHAPARRAKLLAAVRRLLPRKGFSAITTAEVARIAGVSEPILYRHFASKRAMLKSLIEEVVGEVTREMEQLAAATDDPVEALHRICRGYSALAQRHDRDFQIIHRALVEVADRDTIRLLREHYRCYEKLLTRYIVHGQSLGRIREDIAAATIAWHLIHAALGFVVARPLTPPDVRDSDLSELILRGVIRGESDPPS